MSAVESLSLSQMTTEELNTTGSAFVKIIAPLQSDSFIDRISSKIETAVEQYSMIPGTPQTKEDSSQIQKIDDEIDRTIPMLESVLKTNLDQIAYFPEKATASKELLKAFDLCDRRELIYGNYAKQETQLNKLLGLGLSEEMASHRETSGTAPIWTSLNTLNTNLRALLVKRLESGNLEVTSKDIRATLKYRIGCLLTYLDMNITDGIEGFSEIQDSVNELIRETMAKVKARKTRKENVDVSVEETVAS